LTRELLELTARRPPCEYRHEARIAVAEAVVEILAVGTACEPDWASATRSTAVPPRCERTGSWFSERPESARAGVAPKGDHHAIFERSVRMAAIGGEQKLINRSA